MHLEKVIERVNLRVQDIQPLETFDLILLQELDRAGIDQIELGEAWYDDDGGYRWPTPRLIQYPDGHLRQFGG